MDTANKSLMSFQNSLSVLYFSFSLVTPSTGSATVGETPDEGGFYAHCLIHLRAANRAHGRDYIGVELDATYHATQNQLHDSSIT